MRKRQKKPTNSTSVAAVAGRKKRKTPTPRRRRKPTNSIPKRRKKRIKPIPFAVSSGLVLLVLLGSITLLFRGCSFLWDAWVSDSSSPQQQAEVKSEVLPLASLPPQQRASQLETIATTGNSLDQNRARYLLASDLIAQQQGEAALYWLQGLAHNYPILAPQIALKRARAYQLSNQPAKREDTLRQLIQGDRDSSAVAEALYRLRESNSDYIEQAIAQFPSHPRTLEIARQRLEENPEQPQLLRILAKYAPTKKGMDEVRDRLVDESPAQLTPQDWEAIAFGYWEKKEYGKAGAAYAQAPRTPRNAYIAARGRHLSGETTAAKAAYQVLISDFPDAQQTGLGLRRLASLSQPPQALDYLERAIENFPSEAAPALLAKAEILDNRGSSKSAAQAREKVLNDYPHSEAAAEYRWRIAQQHKTAGELKLAWQWTKPLTSSEHSSDTAAKAAFWNGKWAEQLGQESDAKTAFERVLTHHPESYFAWRSAVLLGLDVGDFTSLPQKMPKVVNPTTKALPPAGSDSFKELYQLGQNEDAWVVWQAESGSPANYTVPEQFTDSLLHLTRGNYQQALHDIWSLQQRENSQDQTQWQALRKQPQYWYALFPFPYEQIILNWSEQRQLNPLLVTSLIRKESRFQTEVGSAVGATGLMQLMPATAEWAARKINLEDYSLTNPEDNIKLGTWYLNHVLAEYDNNSLLAIASYNAGPSNVAKWVKKYDASEPDTFVKNIPFPETKGYVEGIFGNYWNYLRIYNQEVSQLVSEYED
ncbi:MAG: tail length tape measure protein [Cyanobacteria bacterium SW_4_48_29]|nr:MAG: tail length tape measure protein [Cyanobacteria bacterium QH_3_48_40]PSP24657.1 MAG: tail length tape measure protein [Cyanobacteria bacterium SW_8_48_13]PSP30049.1 MAG: tail length tape measure protein [Cyanobacteria bacterium SW_4_48_29]